MVKNSWKSHILVKSTQLKRKFGKTSKISRCVRHPKLATLARVAPQGLVNNQKLPHSSISGQFNMPVEQLPNQLVPNRCSMQTEDQIRLHLFKTSLDLSLLLKPKQESPVMIYSKMALSTRVPKSGKQRSKSNKGLLILLPEVSTE